MTKTIWIAGSVPLAPSQPQVVDIDSDWVTLMWAPPPVTRAGYSGSNEVHGYVVESREMGDPTWMPCSDRLIAGTQLTGS